jgi:hypothetical protein
MEIEVEEDIKPLPIKGRTYECPVCNYKDGWHVSFTPHLDKLKIILICPDCHSRFDPNWVIDKSIEQSITE